MVVNKNVNHEKEIKKCIANIKKKIKTQNRYYEL